MIDILTELVIKMDLFDPFIDPTIVKREYGYSSLIQLDHNKKYDCIILAILHKTELFSDNFIKNIRSPKSIIIDIKGVLPIIQI